MSKLYDIVNKTINAPSMDEAEQILFGNDGIVINSNEYYKNIISNFGKKKESIIRKTIVSNGKTQLVFDLNNCNDMWNILFIYNYYIRYIEQKIELLDLDINKYKNIQKNLNNEKKVLTPNDLRYREVLKELERVSLNVKELGDLKNKYSSYKNESLKKHIVQLENMKNIDGEKLKQYLDKLKEAVCCIQKMRDAFEHSNNNLSLDKFVSIDNSRDKFEISIPIEYLDGFTKGKIIAKEEDKIIVEQTNNISSPLLEALNYDIKKIDSFFYNVEPSYLEFILEKVNFDVKQLYKLSPYIFSNARSTEIFLANGLDLFNISKLPFTAFVYPENTIKLKNMGINIYRLPEYCFENIKDTINFYALLDLDIYMLSEKAFSDIKKVIIFAKLGIDVCKLPDFAFDYFENVKKLKELDIDVYNLPEGAFHDVETTIMLKESGIDIYKILDGACFAFLYPENTIKLKELGFNIYELPSGAFYDVETTIKAKEIGIDIYKLSDSVSIALMLSENIVNLKNLNIDIYKLSDYVNKYLQHSTQINKFIGGKFLYPGYTFEYIKKIIKLNILGLNISELSEDALVYVENTVRLKKMDFDIYNLPGIAFHDVEIVDKFNKSGIDVCKLSSDAFAYPENTIKLKELGFNIYQLPRGAFDDVESTSKLKNAGIDIYQLPEEAFFRADIAIKLNEKNIDIYKLPNFIFMYGVSIKNLMKILDKVGYEQLGMFPHEFFYCSIEILDKMLQQYNLNISKSIFGMNNPKIIATLVYANSVLSNYNKDIRTINMDIQPYSIIGDTYAGNFNYRNNIEENIGRKYNSSEFVEQFKLLDEDGFDRSKDDVRKIILNKFRNACAHFRFKIVKDNEGNIIEDKIYIYDEDNKGENNFNLIIDLKDLIEIIREVEIQIELQKNEILSDNTKKR